MADTSTQEQQQQPMNFLATLKNKAPQQNGTGMRLLREYLSSVCTLSLISSARESNRMDCLSVFRPAKDFARSSLFTHRFSLSLSFKQENNNNNRKERRPHRPGLHHHPDNNNRRRGQRRFWGRSRFLGKRRQRRRRRVAARRNQHRLASRRKRTRRSTRA